MCNHEEFKNIEIHWTEGWTRSQYAFGDCVDCPITRFLISRTTPFSQWKRFDCSHSNGVKMDSKIEFKEEQRSHFKYLWAETDGYCPKCKETIRMYARYENIWRRQKIVQKVHQWTPQKMEEHNYVIKNQERWW